MILIFKITMVVIKNKLLLQSKIMRSKRTTSAFKTTMEAARRQHNLKQPIPITNNKTILVLMIITELKKQISTNNL